jgi:NAD(P)-dependent dehydrogenase (short-subunit alcohol dehydrogenase family)
MALNPPLPPWNECRIWVIGASTGIGAATAKLLLHAGARVALSARKAEVLAEVGGDNVRAPIEPLDFTETAQVAAAWTRVRAAWGGIDLVLIVAELRGDSRLGPDRSQRQGAAQDESARRHRYCSHGDASVAGAG